MKTFSGIILSPKVTILHFSHKNVGMISHPLYFFYNNSHLHGHENYRTLIFVVIDFDPEKNRKKRWCKIFGVQYIKIGHCKVYSMDFVTFILKFIKLLNSEF